ncbi:unnamed protein product [Brachionus calyciflorus]|uniref:N-acetyltransferase domain-containing protein n=1 Tax=Brachionus calyciflorus TaxID=104777 RepID=A0A813NKG1_9BILA|nr:unnamed protein product [Brachionus calyciflorus]
MELSKKSKILFGSELGFVRKAEFRKNDHILKTHVYSIRLGKLFDQIVNKSNNEKRNLIRRIFKVNRFNDLKHAIAGIYDVSLPDIGARAIYECICSQKAFTICILKENDDIICDDDVDDDIDCYSEDDCLGSIEENMNENQSFFRDLFSDVSGEEGEDEEDNDTDTDTKGLKSFLARNKIKRAHITKNLIACATLERVSTFQLPGQDEWVIDLQLLAVRNKYRGFSIGKYLINLIQNHDLVGNYDAIVTCSDNNAIKFYEKYAFSSDPILNSKYSHVGDIWTDATKMCYIPPYFSSNGLDLSIQFKPIISEIENEVKLDEILESDTQLGIQDIMSNETEDESSKFIAELTNMERDYKRWQKLMFSSYQFQSKLFFKFKQEILTLKANLCAKNSLIEDLKIKNDILTKNNRLLKLKIDDLETKKEFSNLKKNDECSNIQISDYELSIND